LQVAYDFTQSEHSHSNGDETDAVGKFKNPEGKALRAGIYIGANETQQQPENHHANSME
jgi:hypothetical protein